MVENALMTIKMDNRNPHRHNNNNNPKPRRPKHKAILQDAAGFPL
jgi:hypothetical protein